MKPALRLVSDRPDQFRRLAEMVVRIPPRADVVAYPSGHIWRRNAAHESYVLKVKEAVER